MITYPKHDPELSDTYQAARRAAWAGYQRWGQEPDLWFDDAIQDAAITYYRAHYLLDRSDVYAFVAARNRVVTHRFRRNHNPHAYSIDQPLPHNGSQVPWDDILIHQPDDTPPDWRLTDDEIRQALTQVIRSHKVDVDRYIRLIHLLRRGCSNLAASLIMDLSEPAVASMRRQLRAWLKAYCAANGIPIPDTTPSPEARAHTSFLAHYQRKESAP